MDQNPHQNLQYIMKKKKKPMVCKHCKQAIDSERKFRGISKTERL